jgi:hypothetical protein
MLVREDSAGDRQQPWQLAFWVGHPLNPTPGDGKGLGNRVLGVGLYRHSPKGKGQDSAMMALKDSLKTEEGWAPHVARDAR